MPNTKSAAKAMRGSARKRVINLATITKYKDAVKAARKLIIESKSAQGGSAPGGKKDEAQKVLSAAFAQLDKAAKKHVIHKNKSARLKSRLSHAIAKIA